MHMQRISYLMALVFLSCAGKAPAPATSAAAKAEIQKPTKHIFRGNEIWVQYPSDTVDVKGDLLLLPGWNFSNTKWCDSTDVCKTALGKGYRIIAPQMGQSIYATKYFAQTRSDLSKYPTLLWLDSALEFLQDSCGLFNKKNYVLGLSTGARGVAQICEKRPHFFAAAAALSGDYNQLSLPNDPLCSLVYGPITQYRKRWTEIDNPEEYLKSHTWTTPLYLGHGALDKVVPVAQTLAFGKALSKQPGLAGSEMIKLHVDPAAAHTFAYWRSELPAIWLFFESH